MSSREGRLSSEAGLVVVLGGGVGGRVQGASLTWGHPGARRGRLGEGQREHGCQGDIYWQRKSPTGCRDHRQEWVYRF
jgi:hypothetical protein